MPRNRLGVRLTPALEEKIANFILAGGFPQVAAEAAGVRGVPSLLTGDGESHWGMGGLERLLEGRPLVPRAV